MAHCRKKEISEVDSLAKDSFCRPDSGEEDFQDDMPEELPSQLIVDCELCWAQCDMCHQWSVVERGHSPLGQKWNCYENKWNPSLAQCLKEGEFYDRLQEFSGITHQERSPTIGQIRINLWVLYNLVTQLGGWTSVASNHWAVHLMKCLPEWTPLAWQLNSAAQLQAIYRKHLLQFEQASFAGNRYPSRFDKWLLWRVPGEPQGETLEERRIRLARDAATLESYFVGKGYSFARKFFEATGPPSSTLSVGNRINIVDPLSWEVLPRQPFLCSPMIMPREARDGLPQNRKPTWQEKEMLWLSCKECGQRTLLEVGESVEDEEHWLCTRNTWNPNMAHCLTAKDFMAQLHAVHLHSRGRDGVPLMENLPRVRGEPLDLWWLYNAITQMGGWHTVYSNTWLRWVYRQKDDWVGMTDIGNRLKIAYLAFLYPFERKHFTGKTYSTPRERDLLWHSRGPPGKGDSVPPQPPPPSSVGQRVTWAPAPAPVPGNPMPASLSPLPPPPPLPKAIGGLDSDWLPDPKRRRLERDSSPIPSEACSDDSSTCSNYVPSAFPRPRSTRREADPAERPGRGTTSITEVVDITKFELGWVSCDVCGQWSIIERGRPMPGGRQKWQCPNNFTNPQLARCVQREDFLRALRGYWARMEFSPDDPSPQIAGQPVDLWELYNMMTQLGGFDTVTTNTWWFVFTKDQPSWAAMRGSVLRLKGIYRHYLLSFEREYFHGNRYETVDEVMRLWRDNSRGDCGGPLPDEEGYFIPMTDKKVMRKFVVEEEEAASLRRGRKLGGAVLPAPPEVHFPPVERVPIPAQLEGELGWIECEHCGQWATVEAGYTMPSAHLKWRCQQNRWNPAMAQCVHEEDFHQALHEWWAIHYKEEFASGRVLEIRGEKVSLWYIYNMVTQLGGWATVWANGWLPIIYREKPAWASLTSIGNKMKQIYLKFLYAFEQAHFRGKRYATMKEGTQLWRRGGILGLGISAVALYRGHEGQEFSEGAGSCSHADFHGHAIAMPSKWAAPVEMGSRVWVKCEEGLWLPGKVVEAPELNTLCREMLPLHELDDNSSLLVQLFGRWTLPYCISPKVYSKDAVHPWEWALHIKRQASLSVPELALAMKEAEADGQHSEMH